MHRVKVTCFYYWRPCVYFCKMLNYSFNPSLDPTSLLPCVRGDLIGGADRNKLCESGLGDGVTVFYEPLKFYSSLRRCSLQPQGHHALNKLPSHPTSSSPISAIPLPLPQTLPPTDLMDCLLFDVRVGLHHFFPSLAPSLFFSWLLCLVVQRSEWCGPSAYLTSTLCLILNVIPGRFGSSKHAHRL